MKSALRPTDNLSFKNLGASLRTVAPELTLLIYDKRLERVSREFKSWVRRFPYRYGVSSGEKLKDLRAFPRHFAKLAKLGADLSPRTMTVLAVGGGSVGDFAGFFASVYKRGVRLVHMPSTWLAAVDSSHGGKTALNSGGAKNQLGTFYPAVQVLLVKSLLRGQPPERVNDAMSELGKIALIDGGAWVRKLESSRVSGGELLWNFLTDAINAKMKVVSQDPQETTGIRQILNLGHTVGHVLEAAHGWTHGFAVGQGLFFAIEWSEARGDLSRREASRVRALLQKRLGLALRQPAQPIKASLFSELLLQDKKKSSSRAVTFIFLRRIGRAERLPVTVGEILSEARRQGWVGK